MGKRTEAVGLGLPDDWQELPLDAEAFDENLRRVLDELTEAGVAMVKRRRLELLQRQVRDLLVAGNAVHAAMLATVLRSDQADEDADEPAEDDAVLSAASVITVVDRQELGAPGPLTVDVLLRGLTSPEDDGPVDLDPPRREDLPAGPAVRLARLQRAQTGPIGHVEFVVQSYLLPIDGGERLCTLQLVTPTVEHGGAFSELFDAIAQTLRVFGEGEPTSFATPSEAATTDDAGTSTDAGGSEP